MATEAPQQQTQTLFEQIGGEAGVRKLVDEFYHRVMMDPELHLFFAHTPMDRLARMQYEFFAAALDGPLAYAGKSLSFAHFGRGVTKEHFGRFIEKLLETLKHLNLDEKTICAIIDRLDVYSDEITGGTNWSE